VQSQYEHNYRLLLQHQLKPAAAGVQAPATAAFREHNETLRLGYELDKRSQNYDPDAPDWNKVTELPFVASPAPMRTHYMLATVRDGEWILGFSAEVHLLTGLLFTEAVHISPVDGMYQMRPDLVHVNDGLPNPYADKSKAGNSAMQKIEVRACCCLCQPYFSKVHTHASTNN